MRSSRRATGGRRTWILALGLVGCLGGQTGQESEVAPHCEEQTQAVELDESTSLGFSAQQVLEAAGTPFSVPARFFKAGITREVSVTLEGATAARVVTARPGSVGCDERLEIEVSMTFITDDGAFDETFATTLEAHEASSWSFEHTLRLGQLHGSYSASEYDLQAWSGPRIRIDAQQRGELFSGRLSLEGDDPEPADGGEPTSALVAEWPFFP